MYSKQNRRVRMSITGNLFRKTISFKKFRFHIMSTDIALKGMRILLVAD